MSLIILSFKIEDGVKSTLTKANLARAAKNALGAAAEYWRDVIMPERFTPGVQTRYTFEQRTDVYLRILKRMFGQGAGKTALLQLRGRSFRFAKYFNRITKTRSMATITMQMPIYFTERRTGTVYEKGKRKRIRHQPDMVRELTQVTRQNEFDINKRASEVYFAHFHNDASSWSTIAANLEILQTITTVIT